MRKTHLNKILFLVGYWTLAAVFYVSFEAATLEGCTLIGRPFDYSISLAVAMLGTIFPSTAIASFEILYFNKLLRRKYLYFPPLQYYLPLVSSLKNHYFKKKLLIHSLHI